MKKYLLLMLIAIVSFFIVSCDEATMTTTAVTTSESTSGTTTVSTLAESDIYQLLIEAEELSGMTRYDGLIIREDGDLELPTEYNGVTITYSSRNEAIISDSGIVTLPDTCWLESRSQDAEEVFENLNDNWPVVVDVLMEYMGQTRSAKLMFVIAPAAGFTCDKYLGD
ncbi:MAG: hypothetical protein JXB20_05255 [Bacilli bacterium]|nr:hypothetical protein [Bacilli bacterium]